MASGRHGCGTGNSGNGGGGVGKQGQWHTAQILLHKPILHAQASS